MNCNQSRPRLELASPYLFPTTITITPRAPVLSRSYRLSLIIFLLVANSVIKFCIPDLLFESTSFLKEFQAKWSTGMPQFTIFFSQFMGDKITAINEVS